MLSVHPIKKNNRITIKNILRWPNNRKWTFEHSSFEVLLIHDIFQWNNIEIPIQKHQNNRNMNAGIETTTTLASISFILSKYSTVSVTLHTQDFRKTFKKKNTHNNKPNQMPRRQNTWVEFWFGLVFRYHFQWLPYKLQ